MGVGSKTYSASISLFCSIISSRIVNDFHEDLKGKAKCETKLFQNTQKSIVKSRRFQVGLSWAELGIKANVERVQLGQDVR